MVSKLFGLIEGMHATGDLIMLPEGTLLCVVSPEDPAGTYPQSQRIIMLTRDVAVIYMGLDSFGRGIFVFDGKPMVLYGSARLVQGRIIQSIISMAPEKGLCGHNCLKTGQQRRRILAEDLARLHDAHSGGKIEVGIDINELLQFLCHAVSLSSVMAKHALHMPGRFRGNLHVMQRQCGIGYASGKQHGPVHGPSKS